MRLAAALVLCGLPITCARAVELQKETVEAFDRYVRETEAGLAQRLQPGSSFLWVDDQPERTRQVRAGKVVIENRGGRDTIPAPKGLIHDLIGAVFIPGATLGQTLALVQDYNRHQDIYKPEVLASRLLSRDGNDFKIHLRVMKKKVITVVLDTDYDVHYYPLDAARCHSRAYSTRIVEVENRGQPDERETTPGNDRGFLWRLNSYWRFQERDGGVYVECEAISLTRDIPVGLAWLIQPIIETLPRESLANTLRTTRAALAK